MKFAMLTYAAEDHWPYGADSRASRADAMPGSAEQLVKDLCATGELVYGVGLADPTLTQTLEIRDGVPMVTDGPYPQGRYCLAGLGIVDVASHDRALQVAARTATVFGRVEMRPLDDELDAVTECDLR